MFFAIVFIAIGLAILLNTLGYLSATVWGVFWAIFFMAIGIRMLAKKHGCPLCNVKAWHGKMGGSCCDEEECECDCECEHDKK